MYKALYKFLGQSEHLWSCGKARGGGINVTVYSQGKVWKSSEDARNKSGCQLKGKTVIPSVQNYLYGWLDL